jgi:8-oxo-dGTP pyrophosphatase MutT (NUDIX family)
MSPQRTPSGETLDPCDSVGPLPPAPCPAFGGARALPVVAGILTDADGRVLIAQRAPGGSEAGKWEFAGGKIAPFEATQAALRRELQEELGIAAGRHRGAFAGALAWRPRVR